MHVAVMGQGYVGVTGAVELTLQGHHVTGVEQNPARLRGLRGGHVPFSEPGLQQALSAALATGRLSFTGGLGPPHRHRPFDVALIAVGTPPDGHGWVDLSQVRTALDAVLRLRPAPRVVAVKSTIPPGTSNTLAAAHPGLRERYVHNPEFLSQGSALRDWACPARIVVGLWSHDLLPALRDLYAGPACEWVVTSPTGAEIIKYAANAFLATKISFGNEIARLCSLPDVNVDHVMRGIGADPRIGHALLQPGLGFGDHCLPKDTAALARWAATLGVPTPLLDATIAVNRDQPQLVVRTLQSALDGQLPDAVVAVLGLRYQPWSDDLRAAPSRNIVPALLDQAAEVRVWDPATGKDDIAALFPGTRPADCLSTAVQGAHAAVILTEWPDIVEADWRILSGLLTEPRLIVDGKNCLPPRQLLSLPARYHSIGSRPPTTEPTPRPALNDPT
ncbi:UDP-glucose 6-dehydrogenase [Streptomyces sp. Y2F8-2]|uniref:UDP-glucose dehydrogenase family protein n=1 Tax=Streptomyces sp. Y2F8-2 TaxID=2759675 RepID=UPI00190575B7|nr:nucleotide sugar dehydrogenase [Streptomyces sp. Y2F8-2]GHK03932.1 UDP-glucose 6-dehydrogenase [Streptomyces sp. Y2F8-2]